MEKEIQTLTSDIKNLNQRMNNSNQAQKLNDLNALLFKKEEELLQLYEEEQTVHS